MQSYSEKEIDNTGNASAATLSQRSSKEKALPHFIDNRTETISQRKLQEMANSSRTFQKKENNTGLTEQALQVSHPAKGNFPLKQPAKSPAINSNTAPIQGEWLYYDGDDPWYKFIFWEHDVEGDDPDYDAIPSIWGGYRIVSTHEMAGWYYRANSSERTLRDKNKGKKKSPAYTLDQYITLNGKGAITRPSFDNYNPFGRFDSSAKTSSFVPSTSFPHDRYTEMIEEFRNKDKTFSEYDYGKTMAYLDLKIKEGTRKDELYRWGFPVCISTVDDKILSLVSRSEFGAVYSDVLPSNDRARVVNPESDPSELGWNDVPGGIEMVHVDEEEKGIKIVNNSNISKNQIESWEGKKRSRSQNQVMGTSALEVAINKGFDPDEGLGWEWLHLIAHSMGGIEVDGPQVEDNLVAGTTECNTQMIVVEEFIKDVVKKTGGKAKLTVMAKMLDTIRHIGEFIQYDFIIYDKLQNPLAVYTWRFDCLGRTQPLVFENRELRFSGRSIYGSDEFKFGREYTFEKLEDGDSMELDSNQAEPEINKQDLAMLVRSMSKERIAEVRIMLGLDENQNNMQSIFETLYGMGRDVFFDVLSGSSVDIALTNEFATVVDTNLQELGMIRQPAEGIGFICLIDSIHQILAVNGINVDRQALVNQVHHVTGRQPGDMIEIIGEEGRNVMRAVDQVVHHTTGHHISLRAHLHLVMPDGSIVPFYNANNLQVPTGEELQLDLLFINNNHYEPLFIGNW